MTLGDFSFELSRFEFSGREVLLEIGVFDFEISGLEFNSGELSFGYGGDANALPFCS